MEGRCGSLGHVRVSDEDGLIGLVYTIIIHSRVFRTDASVILA